MATHDSLLVRHALAVLKEYANDRDAKPGPSLQLALRVLVAYVPDQHELNVYWRVAQHPATQQRRGNLRSILDTIKRQVRRR